MAAFNITAEDRDLITRAVATEVDHALARSNPVEYQRQIAGVVDTIINRSASGQFGESVEAVLNAPNQFSAINGPRDRKYRVYGSVRAIPDSAVPAGVSTVVNGWINERIAGAPSSVGGGLHYANPVASDKQNLGWIYALEGPRYGTGQSTHYHGTTAGYRPFEATITGDYYNGQGIKLPPGEIPNVVGSLLDVAQPRTYGPIDPDAVPGTPAIRQGLLDTLKEGPRYRQFLPPLADAPKMDSVGPGATRAELAAFRGPTRSRMDEIGVGATRAELAKLSGADRPRPVSQTKRPRPESYAGQERGEGPAPRRMDDVGAGATRLGLLNMLGPRMDNVGRMPEMSALQEMLGTGSQARGRSANFTRAADLDNSTINAFTPVTTRDGQKVISVADMLFGDEMTTALPGGTRRRIPSGGLVGEMSEPMPAATATRSGSSTRPASLLAALTGDGMAWDAAQDGPTRRAGADKRQQVASVPTNGSYAGQERGETVRRPNQGSLTPTNSSGIFRVAGLNGAAGNVGLPSGVRPDVDIPDFEADWSDRAPTVQRRDEIESGANWDDFTGIFGARQPQELERKPNPFAYVEPPTTLATPRPQGQQGQQGLTAVGNVPQFRTVTREQRYENPEYRTWKANQTGQTNAVPLGEIVNFGARDTIAERERRRQEALNFVATQMPQQWLTRQVQVQVPVKPQPVAQAAPVTVRGPAQQPAAAPQGNPLQFVMGNSTPQTGPLASILGLGGSSRAPTYVNRVRDELGISAAAAYDLANAQERAPTNAWERMLGIWGGDTGISENNRTPSIGGGN